MVHVYVYIHAHAWSILTTAALCAMQVLHGWCDWFCGTLQCCIHDCLCQCVIVIVGPARCTDRCLHGTAIEHASFMC